MHHGGDSNKKAIFAYSVRSDWYEKLKSDCRRIHEEKHNPENIVFVCTSTLSGNDKDKAHDFVTSKYSWSVPKSPWIH